MIELLFLGSAICVFIAGWLSCVIHQKHQINQKIKTIHNIEQVCCQPKLHKQLEEIHNAEGNHDKRQTKSKQHHK